MVEFTGERVIPDQVNPDLWSEHFARYAFASSYAGGKRVLDCGCGTGYGSAELAQTAAEVTGVDVSTDAIEYARVNFASRNTRYITGSCLNLSFPAESFDLVVAFEVIEHLSDFRRFLEEVARVLAPGGLFIVSTPNKSYYGESRADSGPNPFHRHEFEAGEFRNELNRVFPHTTVLLQNRTECFIFAGDCLENLQSRTDAGSGPAEEAHFFIAVCSNCALPEVRSFLYLPAATNLLREREQHIRLLQEQIRRTQDWLSETQEERDRLLKQYRDLLAAFDRQKLELEARNHWAESLNIELRNARQRIDQVQRELAAEQKAAAEIATAYNAKVRDLETENVDKTKWALETEKRLTIEMEQVRKELTECVQLLKAAEETVVSRTVWAQELDAKLTAVRKSRWLRLGRILGLGPNLK